ncbi:MAG: GNAT family N-acetyltransferase [Bacteroides sp.]
MIEIKRLHSSKSPYYPFVEQLLTLSFPTEEYRPLVEWKRYTDEVEAFHNQVILNDDRPVGLVTHWDFGSFCYVEHLAIAPEARNGGYGGRLLQLLQAHLQRPIVLEVEEPTEEMARRRIGFYQRHGFQLWGNPYLQPPYREGDGLLPMHIMVWGALREEEVFDEVKQTLYREVYHYTPSQQ